MEGRESQIFAAHDRKLEEARRLGQLRRQQAFIKPPDRTGDSSTVALN
ncbi:MAG TPA: hypothetical protein VKM93_06795 [Terriglobia bacterium]|nr:hypothetical protein [Terriglobia bacterium]